MGNTKTVNAIIESFICFERVSGPWSRDIKLNRLATGYEMCKLA